MRTWYVLTLTNRNGTDTYVLATPAERGETLLSEMERDPDQTSVTGTLQAPDRDTAMTLVMRGEWRRDC